MASFYSGCLLSSLLCHWLVVRAGRRGSNVVPLAGALKWAIRLAEMGRDGGSERVPCCGGEVTVVWVIMWIGVQTEEGELWGETEDWIGERDVMTCGCSHIFFLQAPRKTSCCRREDSRCSFIGYDAMSISLVKEHAASTSVLKMETACSSEVWHQPTWLHAWFQASAFEVAENWSLLGYYTVSSGKLHNNQEECRSIPDYMIYNPES